MNRASDVGHRCPEHWAKRPPSRVCFRMFQCCCRDRVTGGQQPAGYFRTTSEKGLWCSQHKRQLPHVTGAHCVCVPRRHTARTVVTLANAYSRPQLPPDAHLGGGHEGPSDWGPAARTGSWVRGFWPGQEPLRPSGEWPRGGSPPSLALKQQSQAKLQRNTRRLG